MPKTINPALAALAVSLMALALAACGQGGGTTQPAARWQTLTRGPAFAASCCALPLTSSGEQQWAFSPVKNC